MRVWSNKGEDDGSIHPIGNGEMLVYGQGPNIIHMFGPPYSAPSFLRMEVDEPGRIIVSTSERENGTAVWHHNIKSVEHHLAHITDYMLPDQAVFIRDIEADGILNFKIIPSENVKISFLHDYFEHLEEGVNSFILTISKGSTFFTSDSVLQEINMVITTERNIFLKGTPDGTIHICTKTKKSRLIFSSGPLPAVVGQTERILQGPGEDWLDKARKYWSTFSVRRKDFSSMIPQDHPLRNKILDVIDSVSVLIKCQQSNSGGVAAGHYYNMAYVRDQSGVMRGLLALGYTSEARAILDFWKYKWDLFGNLNNAEGMGNNSARLMFTNDEVEIPAYIIINCFHYYYVTGDDDFLTQVFPMMEWALKVQLVHLVEGMTEFSGDETYIAGSTYPQHFLYHGSAESTLLFITGGEKLLEWAEKRALWSGDKLEKYRQKIAYAKHKYKENFMEGGTLYANNPLREEIAGRPRYRFSFCEGHHYLQKTLVITWNERDNRGYYVCPECRGTIMPEVSDMNRRYVLNSVNLIPIYIGSNMFTSEEIQKILSQTIDSFKDKGYVSSNTEGERSLGYDYGLMLYNMVKLNHPIKDKVFEKALSLIDSTGAWVEYYDGDKPFNCRARPWESAINIEAVIEYIKNL